jgi:tetratricopeptide (TPR) repeat protein
MSTIDEALKKAQKERDTRYQGYSASLSVRGKGSRLFPGRTLLWISLTLVIGFIVFASYSWLDFRASKTPVSEAGSSTNEEGLARLPLRARPPAEQGEAAWGTNGQGGVEKREFLRNKLRNPATDTRPETVKDVKESYDRARLFHKNGSLQDAGRLYRETLRVDPGYVDALNNLGVIYIQEKDYLAAQASLEKAIRLKPGYVEPYYNLACLYAIKGEIGESLPYLRKAVSLDQSVRDWARRDTDLENLRGLPEFNEIIKIIK